MGNKPLASVKTWEEMLDLLDLIKHDAARLVDTEQTNNSGNRSQYQHYFVIRGRQLKDVMVLHSCGSIVGWLRRSCSSTFRSRGASRTTAMRRLRFQIRRFGCYYGGSDRYRQ